MMTQLEDLRLALRQICRALGLSGTAATVVPLVVLGIALNIVALNVVQGMRHKHAVNGTAVLRGAARTELRVMKTVLISTLKKIGDGQRRWCVAEQWVADRQMEVAGYHIEVGFVWAAPSASEGCDVKITDNPVRKTAIAFVQC